jgi:hypothetical protein
MSIKMCDVQRALDRVSHRASSKDEDMVLSAEDVASWVAAVMMEILENAESREES